METTIRWWPLRNRYSYDRIYDAKVRVRALWRYIRDTDRVGFDTARQFAVYVALKG
jgi:hypothetical protein